MGRQERRTSKWATDGESFEQRQLDMDAARRRLGASPDAWLRRVIEFTEEDPKTLATGARADFRAEFMALARHLPVAGREPVGRGAVARMERAYFNADPAEEEWLDVWKQLKERFAGLRKGQPWPLAQEGLIARVDEKQGSVTLTPVVETH